MASIRVRRALVAAVAGVVVAASLAVAAASAESPGVSCTGPAPDADGRVTLDCTIPMPSAVTVTTPVPTTVTQTVTQTVTATPPTTTTTTTAPPTTVPPTTPAPTTTPSGQTHPPIPAGFPTPATTGTPPGWQPAVTRTGTWRITSPGVYEDVRVIGSIVINADNVTLRRVEVLGGQIVLWRSTRDSTCYNGLVVEDSSFLPSPDGWGGPTDGVIVPGNYTVRNVKIENRIEGLRSGACGPVVAENTYIHIRLPAGSNAHSDGIQGYNGRGLILRNVAIDFREAMRGTSPLFYPRPDNWPPVEIDGLWLAGGGYSLRLGVGPATLRNVQILDKSWGYGPVEVYCPAVTLWDVSIVDAQGRKLRQANCTGSGR